MQIENIKHMLGLLGPNAGLFVVTESFFRGVHNTATEQVLLFPPDWEEETKTPILIQLDDQDMPVGIRANWREWSISDQLGYNAQFVNTLADDPWYGVGEG